MKVIYKLILFLTIINTISLTYKIEIGNVKNNNECQDDTCNIGIVFDTSSDILNNQLFIKSKNILQYNLSTEIPHFNQVSFTSFNENINISTFGMFKNKDEFSEIVKSLKQSPGFSLSKALYSVNNLSYTSTNRQSTFVFISKYDKEEIKKSIEYAKELWKKGSLNFIIMGDGILPIQLLPLHPSSIYLLTFDKNDTIQLKSFFYNNLLCFDKDCLKKKDIKY
ncbi:von Willebrand factor, type A domain-containing protein [Strongyloides ratti]|uniref:von Willebrand factor, type A domain-containing protein n=1 Tax=Strongyloides ratti TaxID=34506 RepID=A0A090KXW6_STRRB|nr:von Willebrand factor, type A domain-containing protein [Strongyloides ratti]CEF60078.1 von Willebrand factor, type A domain-containing protein [Strongyloides ratti]